MMGRRLLDSCINCQDFGIEAVHNGTMTARCDRGEISSCLKNFTGVEKPAGYI